MNCVFELATEADVDEVAESCLGVFLEVLVPQADPVLDADSTLVLIVAIS